MNYADSARIKAVLTHCGFSYTEDIKKADIVIFDTCSVRQKAEDKVTGKLLEISKKQKVWITGCMVGHHKKNKKSFFLRNLQKKRPNIELFWNIEDTGHFPSMLKKL